MNEKIKQLYNRALYEYFGEEYKNCELDIYPEDQYFAELIIKECARIAAHVGENNVKLGYLVPLECSNTIKEHFGVK